MKNGIFLNLGCGTDIREPGNGWINIDVRKLSGVNQICDVRHLPFKDESVNYILASDILEHFSYFETVPILVEWKRVLKPTGTLEIRVPNLEYIVKRYLDPNDKTWNAEYTSLHLMGGQNYETNYHYIVFDIPWFKSIVQSVGFNVLSVLEECSNIRMIVSKQTT